MRFCDAGLLDRLHASDIGRDLNLADEAASPDRDPLAEVRATNLSCFRAWLEAWLERHPKIDDDMTSMVRELEPDGRGVPVEIYVFSNDQRWEYYERLQAGIIDQVLAVLPLFGLRLFQDPTGEDVRSVRP